MAQLVSATVKGVESLFFRVGRYFNRRGLLGPLSLSSLGFLSNRSSSTMPGNEIEKIRDKIAIKMPERKEVRMDSLWENNTCVITYLRRFGWMFCRQGAKDLSKIYPLLKARDIRLIGIGLEEEGVQDFIDAEYFAGELYVDPKKEQYRALAFKQFNICNILGVMFSRIGRAMISKAKENGTPNNFKGNGFLTGGTLIISKGGKDVILFYRQEELADHLENSKILEALGIDEELASEVKDAVVDKQPEAVECTDVCTRKTK